MTFIPGNELSRRYWHEVVAPILDDLLPGVPRAAAAIGNGSDVLGFDTERSTDHGWGPRVTVFLPDDFPLAPTERAALRDAIDLQLPNEFLGHATRFAFPSDGPPTHQVRLTTVSEWFTRRLGFDPRHGVATSDWLAAPSQLLREATAGAVFEDAPGELTAARAALAWYPDDVWLYLLGCQWRRIDQEEPFVGRTGEVGDELGSAVVGARLVRDIMRLCFLIEREYAPYAKWLGTAFSRLECGPELTPMMVEALAARSWKERESALIPVYETLAERFNALGVTEPQEPTVRGFHDRPFRVLSSGRFVDACMARTPLASLGFAGSIDQFADSTDILSNPRAAQRLQQYFDTDA